MAPAKFTPERYSLDCCTSVPDTGEAKQNPDGRLPTRNANLHSNRTIKKIRISAHKSNQPTKTPQPKNNNKHQHFNMAEAKKNTSSKQWYLQKENRERYAGISADGTIPEVDREALHRLISVKLAATGFEVPETSTRDEGVMQLASDLFRQYAEQVSQLMNASLPLQRIFLLIVATLAVLVFIG